MPASVQAHPDPSLPVEDDRFTSPRGAAASSYDSPRHELTSYSSDEREDDSMADSSPRSTGLLSRSSLRQPLSILPPTPPQRRSYYKDIAFAKPVKPVDVFSLARHNRVDDVRAVLDRGLPVNTPDEHGNSLLIIACQNGLKRLAKELLRRGANINARNKRRNTPLHFCFAYGYGDTLGAYLISKGADVSLTNDDGLECYYGIEPPPHQLPQQLPQQR
ncbi:hypothetical protein DYB37_013111 [Aphanomyces astaci]|uniref:Uncharacterized protein n=1 Tax=Aphanomyces astaci TaxID=112090 RepID=A0A397AIV9_APHAT|nr:hypothetical protein DYB25_007284 [Aphanomyces astaci]RHZ02083.1 hypothetical protein DYB35_013004 [Aphanomyces astaci]RHZ33528.1 hypothetical protein DYB37_013111 [Aphanomyces astaci]RLO05580.1 hypothetical protein DYB28_004765 [Aphanomyces astaci]